MKVLSLIAATLVLSACANELTWQQGVNSGVDLFGYDMFGVSLTRADPTSCAEVCAATRGCEAWTVVEKGAHGPDPICYVKHFAPEPRANDQCVSGLHADFVLIRKGPTSSSAAQVEPAMDRPGRDFVGFDLRSEDPRLCAQACDAVRDCLSWTYAKPGFLGPDAHCRLKNGVPGQVANSDTVSGVKVTRESSL